MADGAASQTGSNAPLPAYAHRTVLTAADDACGVEPILRLQQGFGAAYLGELLQAYISASNVSTASVQSVQLRVSHLSGCIDSVSSLLVLTRWGAPVSDVKPAWHRRHVMRQQVDLQSERGTNAMLYSTPAALNELKPGAHHDFVARHDLDQVETHSLVCTASYVSPYTGERRQAVQRFNFRVEHALSVRTKVMSAPGNDDHSGPATEKSARPALRSWHALSF